jgi:peptide/nickel transport system substrate-binding protein
MPAAAPDKIGRDGIGTGPFRFVAADPNRSATFERNESYWRKGFPYLDRLEIHNREGQQEAALNGLRARQFDAVLSIDARGLRQVERDGDLEVSVGRGSYHFVIQLPKHPGSPFQDKRIRQAFALAIDREAIVRIAYGGRLGWVGNDSHLVATDPAFLVPPGEARCRDGQEAAGRGRLPQRHHAAHAVLTARNCPRCPATSRSCSRP